MSIQANFLEQYLYEYIPISIAMGVKVREVSTARIVLSAPIAPNINHKKTVFGGSLHALATLSCWSLAFLNLQGLKAEIVITASEIQYLRPVSSDFTVECNMNEPERWIQFKKMFARKGKARIQLHATIYQDGHLAVDYQGEFVAIKV